NSVTVTPTAANATATITVNGSTVLSGKPSAGLPLDVGSNVIAITVTAQDGVPIRTYTVTVTRGPSDDASLADLDLSSGTLSPGFESGTTGYTASVSNATASITVLPTTNDDNATVTVNGAAVMSGTNSASIPLAVGSNNIIQVVVTA